MIGFQSRDKAKFYYWYCYFATIWIVKIFLNYGELYLWFSSGPQLEQPFTLIRNSALMWPSLCRDNELIPVIGKLSGIANYAVNAVERIGEIRN